MKGPIIIELSNNKLLDIKKKTLINLDKPNWTVIGTRGLNIRHNRSSRYTLDSYVTKVLRLDLNKPLDMIILNYDHTVKLGLEKDHINQEDLIKATKQIYLDLLVATNIINEKLKYIKQKNPKFRVIVYQNSVNKYYPFIQSSKSAVKDLIKGYTRNSLPYSHVENINELKTQLSILNE